MIQKSTLTCPQSKKEFNVMPCVLTIYYLYMFFRMDTFHSGSNCVCYESPAGTYNPFGRCVWPHDEI